MTDGVGSGLRAMAAGLVLLLAGCAGDEPSPNPPAGPSGTPSPTPPPRYGAPTVAKPLDPTSLETDPCAAFTERQIASLGGRLDARFEETKRDGTECRWNFEPTGAVYGQVMHYGLEPFYREIYEGSERARSSRPVMIAGYPGIIDDEREHSCALSVGLRDDRVYSANVPEFYPEREGRGSACEVATLAAEFAVSHLSGAP